MPKRRTAGRARKAGVKQEQKPREPEAEREQLAADPTLTAAPKRQRKRRQADPNAPPPFGESQAPPPTPGAQQPYRCSRSNALLGHIVS